jgi:hypothetical protein
MAQVKNKGDCKMGNYTGLRFKGVIKKEFRKDFEPIAMEGAWDVAIKDSKFLDFSCDFRASFIPCGALCYMPGSWETDDVIERTYDQNTGLWTFQCSLKNYGETIENFLEMVPYFIESVEYCEVLYEEWSHSARYELVKGKMIITDEFFKKYD